LWETSRPRQLQAKPHRPSKVEAYFSAPLNKAVVS
jgi:hypothetical protein